MLLVLPELPSFVFTHAGPAEMLPLSVTSAYAAGAANTEPTASAIKVFFIVAPWSRFQMQDTGAKRAAPICLPLQRDPYCMPQCSIARIQAGASMSKYNSQNQELAEQFHGSVVD